MFQFVLKPAKRKNPKTNQEPKEDFRKNLLTKKISMDPKQGLPPQEQKSKLHFLWSCSLSNVVRRRKRRDLKWLCWGTGTINRCYRGLYTLWYLELLADGESMPKVEFEEGLVSWMLVGGEWCEGRRRRQRQRGGLRTDVPCRRRTSHCLRNTDCVAAAMSRVCNSSNKELLWRAIRLHPSLPL